MQRVPAVRTERYQAIIIGGGRAGLTAAWELQGRDVDYLVLDPGVVLPAPTGFRATTEVAATLAAYVAHLDLVLRLGAPVRSLRRTHTHFEIDAGELRYEATSVVVATGTSQATLDAQWIELPIFGADGTPRLDGCVVEGAPGLYVLDASGRDAARIAERISSTAP